jgi:hypothetical protein
LNQADQTVLADERNLQGNNLFFNTPWELMFPNANPDTTAAADSTFLRFAPVAKAAAAQINEDRVEDAIDNFYRTRGPGPLSQADRNQLNDLVLQRESFRNQKMRRFVSTIPGTLTTTGAPISAFFERRANQDDAYLAQNQLYDARQAFQTTKDRASRVKVLNAENMQQQAEDRRDANTYDLLGYGTQFNGAARLGPIFRKRASEQTLQAAYRDLRLAQDNFAKDPSEDNRQQVKLARLFLEANQHDDNANNADVLLSTLIPGGASVSSTITVGSLLINGQEFQDSSKAWLQYDKLKRRILLKQHAAALQTSALGNPVAERMLALSGYGRPAGV